MTPEERELLKKTYELAEENNSILRSMRRGQRWDRVIKYSYWVVIIGLSFGAYYFIQPYVDMIKGSSPLFRSPSGDLSNSSQVFDLLKELNSQ